MIGPDRRRPAAGEPVSAQGIDCQEGPHHVELAPHLLPLDQANRVTGDTERHEVIIVGDRFSDHPDNLAGTLVESLNRGKGGAIILTVGLGQDSFFSSLVNVEPKDLTAELTLDNDSVRPNRGLLRLSGNFKANCETADEKKEKPAAARVCAEKRF